MTEVDFPIARSQTIEILREHITFIDRDQVWLDGWQSGHYDLATRCLNCMANAAINGFFQDMTPNELDNFVSGVEDYCAYSMGSTSELAPQNFQPCEFIP